MRKTALGLAAGLVIALGAAGCGDDERGGVEVEGGSTTGKTTTSPETTPKTTPTTP